MLERDGERMTTTVFTGEDSKFKMGFVGWRLGSSNEVPTIETVVEDSPAESAGFQAGDVVVSAGGQDDIDEFDLLMIIEQAPGAPIDRRDCPGQVERGRCACSTCETTPWSTRTSQRGTPNASRSSRQPSCGGWWRSSALPRDRASARGMGRGRCSRRSDASTPAPTIRDRERRTLESVRARAVRRRG